MRDYHQLYHTKLTIVHINKVMWRKTSRSFFTGRNEVVAKVMFLLVSVILLTGGGGVSEADPLLGSRHPPGLSTPPKKQTPAYGQRAAGTHPTGMHSCFFLKFKFLYLRVHLSFIVKIFEPTPKV